MLYMKSSLLSLLIIKFSYAIYEEGMATTSRMPVCSCFQCSFQLFSFITFFWLSFSGFASVFECFVNGVCCFCFSFLVHSSCSDSSVFDRHPFPVWKTPRLSVSSSAIYIYIYVYTIIFTHAVYLIVLYLICLYVDLICYVCFQCYPICCRRTFNLSSYVPY